MWSHVQVNAVVPLGRGGYGLPSVVRVLREVENRTHTWASWAHCTLRLSGQHRAGCGPAHLCWNAFWPISLAALFTSSGTASFSASETWYTVWPASSR